MAKELITILKLDDAQFKRGLDSDTKAVLGLTAAAVGVTAAIFGAAKAVANYEDEMNDAARATGLTIEEFSALDHVAKLSGVSMEQLSKSMKKLIDPTEQTEAQLRQFGVSLRDSNGQFMDQTKILESLSTKYKSLKNPADQALLAMTAFGEKGSAMAGVLEQDIGKLTEQARLMGVIISKEAAEAAGVFNDNLDVLSGSVTGLTRSVMDSVIAWTNQTGIVEAASKAIQSITGFINELDDETKDAIISAGAAALAVTALAGAAFLLSAGLAAVDAAIAPIIIAVALVAALAAAVVYVEKKFHIFSAAVDGLADSFVTLKAMAQPVIDTVKGFFSEAFNLPDVDFKEFFQGLGREAVRGTAIAIAKVNDLTQAFGKAFDAAKLTKEIISALGTAWDPDKLAAAATQVKTTLQEAGNLVLKDNFAAGEKAVEAYNKRLREAEQSTKDLDEAEKKRGQRNQSNGGNEDKAKGKLEKLQESATAAKAAFSGFVTAVSEWDAGKASAEAEKLGLAISNIVTLIAADAQKVADVMSQVASVQVAEQKRTLDKQLYNLDFISRVQEEQGKAELEQVTAQEDAKIEALRSSQQAQLEILQQGAIARYAQIDAEFAAEKARRELAAQERLAEERLKWEADTAAFLAATLIKEERGIIQEEQDQSWRERERMLDAENKEGLVTLQQTFAARKDSAQKQAAAKELALKKKQDADIAQAEQQKAQKLEELEAKRQQQQKDAAKFKAFLEWAGQNAALQTQKGAQRAQISVATATGAAQAFASLAWIPFVGPALGAAAAGVIISYGARQMAEVGRQIPPPLSLLFADGGVTKGPSHAGGGIDTVIGGRAANVEGQETVLDRGRTRDMFNFIDNLTSGGMGGGNSNTVNIHLYGVRDATPAFAREIWQIATQELNSEAVA